MNKHRELNVSSDELVNQERIRPASIGKFIEQQKCISDVLSQSLTIKNAISAIDWNELDKTKVANNILKFIPKYDEHLSAARQLLEQQESIIQPFREMSLKEQKRIAEFASQQKRITELTLQQISIAESVLKTLSTSEILSNIYGLNKDQFAILNAIRRVVPITGSVFGSGISGMFRDILKTKDQQTGQVFEEFKFDAQAEQERLNSLLNDPNKIEEALKEVEEATAKNAEIAESVISGDNNATSKFLRLVKFCNIVLSLLNILSFLGYTVKDFIEMLQPSSKEIICREYEIENSENAEVRKVRLAKGTLNVRQYPNEKGKVLAELPNGEYICLPNKQKGNQRWLKVQTKDENDNLIIGYVNARFTEKVTFINGEKL